MSANAKNGFLLLSGQWKHHSQVNPRSIVVVNLMPTKATTERQFLEQFNQLTEDVEITFVYPATHRFKGTPFADIATAYRSLADIENQTFDGLIITGAPVEQLPFQDVDYWEEFRTICDWAERHVSQTLLECWAAQAGLYNDFALPKVNLDHKIFGIYQASDADLLMPQSRHATTPVDPARLPGDLKIVANNDQIGPLLLHSNQHHRTYITGHPEYEADTLATEYYRDQKKHLPINRPCHYFTSNGGINYCWQPSSQKIYQHWLNTIALEKVGN